PFQFDDEVQLLLNQRNPNISTFTKLSTWINVNYRPLSTFTLALNYRWGGENVFGYHLFNLMIHLLAGVILFFLLKRLNNFRQNNNSLLLPVVATLFFLLHPAQTQSVTYIVQRMTSLSGMFTLLSVYAYLVGRHEWLITKNKSKSIILLGLAGIASVLGILSKQTAAIIPLLWVLVEWLFVCDNNNKTAKKWAITLTVLTTLLYTGAIAFFGLPTETTEISRISYLATQMTVIPRYLQIMLLPLGLYIDHGLKPIENLFDIKVIAGALLLVSLLILALLKSRKWPLFSFGILWIFITMLIESSVIPIRDVMFDQRMYLPLAGFSVSLWFLIFHLFRNKPKVTATIAFVALLALASATFARNNTWRNQLTIWEEVTERYPDHFRGWMSIGRILAAAESTDYQRIIDSYEKALHIDPSYEPLWNDLGINYGKTGNTAKAIECFKMLENASDPEYKITANRTIGLFSLITNKTDNAEKYLIKTLEIDPADSAAIHGLSTLYIQEKEWEKSLYYAELYLEKSGNNQGLLFNAAYSAFYLMNFDKANEYFDRLLKIDPKNEKALVMQGNTMVNLKRYPEAARFFRKAYNINNRQEYLDAVKRLKNEE
ncbi:MAG TPA: tetratricopeptide repeat protein, partial [Prolixibacteraceae bacterium]|nr:tetratricopeptide repeat protein [Prolixibacteraceae bacterium]